MGADRLETGQSFAMENTQISHQTASKESPVPMTQPGGLHTSITLHLRSFEEAVIRFREIRFTAGNLVVGGLSPIIF